MASFLLAARRKVATALRSYPLLRASTSKSWLQSSRQPSLSITCVRLISSTRINAVDISRKENPRETIGRMEYASTDDENMSNHATPEKESDSAAPEYSPDDGPLITKSSHRYISKEKVHEKFAASLPGRYSRRIYSEGNNTEILVLLDDEQSSYEDVLKRITRFVEVQRSNTTRIFGLEVAQGVHVLRHRVHGDETDKFQGLCLQISINRPLKSNALSGRLMRNLTDTFHAIATIGVVNGVLLKATPLTSGKHAFSAGADIQEMVALKTAKTASQFIKQITRLCKAIRDLPVPVIAAIDGPCIGAGLEVAASCDIRVATSTATFSMPEVHLGIPSVVEARLLCDIVGWGRARHMVLTGCTWSAMEAYQAGLISAQFDKRLDMSDWIGDFMEKCNSSAQAHRVQKALIRKWETLSVDEGIAAGVDSFASRFDLPNLPKVRKLMHQRLQKAVNKNRVKHLDLSASRDNLNGTKRLVLGAGENRDSSENVESESRGDTSSSIQLNEEQPQ